MAKRQITSNFEFKQRYGKLNWEQVIQLDLESILAQGDIESLQSTLENLTYSTIDREDMERIGDSNLIKVFKLSQLATEYLISIHSQLDSTGKEFLTKQKRYYEENLELKNSLVDLEKEVGTLKSEYLEKKKAVQTYELLLKQPGTAAIMNKVVTRANAITCEFCKKAFISHDFLEEHKKRRHTSDLSHDSAPSIEISPFLDIFKTFTEQRIQEVTDSHKREIESLKEIMKMQLEIQRENEASSFQKLLLLQSQAANAHEDMNSKLLMDVKFEKENLAQIISEDIKKIEERDRILADLHLTHKILTREMTEKDEEVNELISHDNSMFRELDVISRPFRPEISDLDLKSDVRSGTPPPEQMQSVLAKQHREKQEKIEESKEKVVKNIEIKFPIDPDESYECDIPVLVENKSEIEVIPQKPLVSNAGDIESDADVVENELGNGSNAGEILTDSDESEENKEEFEVVPEKNVIYPKKWEENDGEEYEKVEVIAMNSEKFEPTALIQRKSLENFEPAFPEEKYSENFEPVVVLKANSSGFPQKSSLNRFDRNETAKLLGINPKVHKQYMYLVDKYLSSPLPSPWELHQQGSEVFYINSETGLSSQVDPNIKLFSEYFSEIKSTHFKVYDNILLLFSNSKILEREKNGKKIECAFEYEEKNIGHHRDKLLRRLLRGEAEESKEKNVHVSRRDMKKQKRLLEMQLKAVMGNEVFEDKSSEFVEKHVRVALKKEESSDLSAGKGEKVMAEQEKNLWDYKQGINLIQNRNILKENIRVTSGVDFQEGTLLGEHYFERNSGLEIDENSHEKVIPN